MTSPPSSPPILILDRVSKRFAGHTAVDELSLSVPRGVIYGLLGPNGAGKTTTIRMIMDILEPDGGAVRVFGERAAVEPTRSGSGTSPRSAACTARCGCSTSSS